MKCSFFLDWNECQMKKAVGKVTSLSGELFNHLQKKKKSVGQNNQISLFIVIYIVLLLLWKYVRIYYLFFFNLNLWNSSLPYNSSFINSSSLKKLLSKLLRIFWLNSSSWNSSTIKNFQIFPMELEFYEFEYLKSGKSLHISKTIVNWYIFW